MVPIELAKKSDANYVRYANQFTRLPNKKYNDMRIYPPAEPYSLLLQGLCLLYHVVYEGAQLAKKGPVYFTYNFKDFLLIVVGYLNIYMQLYAGTWWIYSKIVLILLVTLTMFKTFEFMRVVESFSYIVTMIRAVLFDLRVFLLFYVILLVSFSELLDCFGRNGNEEYFMVGPIVANIFSTLRLLLGDFDFTLIDMQELYWMHVVFWATWIFMVFFSSLIFLNFIIAEVGNSYSKCKEEILPTIQKERAILIAEAEDLHSRTTKESNKNFYPDMVITRRVEK